MKRTVILSLIIAFSYSALAGTVSLTAGDVDNEHSFDTAGHWSDGSAPAGGNDYIVALGDDAALRTPITNITAEANQTFTEFAGDSLTIGTEDTPGALYDYCYRYARLRIPELHLVNGTIWNGVDQIYYSAVHEQALYGTFYVHSTTNNPFTFRNSRSDDNAGLSLRGPLVGDEDSAIRVTTGVNGKYTYLALCNSSPEFKGRIIVEDHGRIWPGPSAMQPNAFGATPETFMKDAVIFRNGGGFASSSSTGWDIVAENRGIWIEGNGNFSSQGSYTIYMPIGGGHLTGKLVFSPHVNGRITVAAPVTCYPVEIQNGPVVFTEKATIDETEPLIMNGSPFFGSSVDREVTLNVKLKSGGGFCYPSSTSSTSLPVITLKEGSIWSATANACWIRLLSSGFPMNNTSLDGWFPVLRVPLSVKDLSEVTFSLKDNMGTYANPNIKIETDATGMQTVSVKPSSYYVVHPDNRPAGHEAVAPYSSWETAATNISDAVNAAVAAMGGRVCVDRGTYDISSPIPMGGKNGSSARPVFLIGLDRTTMKPDAEHVILDGGYPARTNMIFQFSNSSGCSINSMTLTHGCHIGTDSQFHNGGVGALHDASPDFIITGCRFIENFGRYGGALQASIQTITNCYFRGNLAVSGGVCLYNPQGTAGVDSDYLKVYDCVFEDNANVAGTSALVFNGGRNTRFIGCTFRNNGQKNNGMFGFSYYSCVRDCVFDGNNGGVGIGVSADCPYVSSNIVIRNGNIGTSSALSLPANSTCAGVENVTIAGNICGNAIWGSYGNLRNFIVVSNECSNALLKIEDGNTTSVPYTWDSGTFADNISPRAVQMRANNGNTVNTNVFRNCIFWNNRKSNGDIAPNDIDLKKKMIAFTHCDAGMNLGSFDDGTCFAANPKFADAAKGDYRLRHPSPCRDSGLRCDWMDGAIDLAGNPRCTTEGKALADSLPDIGCYECMEKACGTALIVR